MNLSALYDPFRQESCLLNFFLPASEKRTFHFCFLNNYLHRKQSRYPAFLIRLWRPCLFTTRRRMRSHAPSLITLASNLLACIFGSILRAVKKPFRASLRDKRLQRWCTLHLGGEWKRRMIDLPLSPSPSAIKEE